MFYSAHRAAASETNGMGHPVMTVDGASHFPRRYMPDSAREFDGFTVIPGLNRPAMVIFIGTAGEMKRETLERFLPVAPSYLNSHYGYVCGKTQTKTQRPILFERTGKCGYFKLTPAGERVLAELKAGLADRKERDSAPMEYDTPWGW